MFLFTHDKNSSFRIQSLFLGIDFEIHRTTWIFNTLSSEIPWNLSPTSMSTSTSVCTSDDNTVALNSCRPSVLPQLDCEFSSRSRYGRLRFIHPRPSSSREARFAITTAWPVPRQTREILTNTFLIEDILRLILIQLHNVFRRRRLRWHSVG